LRHIQKFKFDVIIDSFVPITKANYKLPEIEQREISEEEKKRAERLEYEQKSIQARGAKGSFVVFREKGLEDVFVVDEL